MPKISTYIFKSIWVLFLYIKDDAMKKIFISHPLVGDIEGNRKKVDKTCKEVLSKDLLPISPLHMFKFIERENIYLRDNIMEVCYGLITISDEVWVYGDTQGCRLERGFAERTGKRVVVKYDTE